MDPYDPALAPAARGLINTGVTCYFNAFLQALSSCTAFAREAATHSDLLRATRTGRALLAYLAAVGCIPPAPERRQADPAGGGVAVLAALVADLAERRPHVRFGHGQESASEALVHLLDMIVPAAPAGRAGGRDAEPPSRLTDLFLHRSTCSVYCLTCRRVSSRTRDHAVNFNLFHIDQIRPGCPVEFARAMSRHVSQLEDYRCEKCETVSPALRVYTLTMVPEILFCAFNLYTGERRARWFPERLALPGSTPGDLLQYRLVGQVEHTGTLHSGHYWARCLRRAPTPSAPAATGVYQLNDMSVSPSVFAPSPSTYLIVYHFEATRRAAAGEWEGLVQPVAEPAEQGAKRASGRGPARGCPPA